MAIFHSSLFSCCERLSSGTATEASLCAPVTAVGGIDSPWLPALTSMTRALHVISDLVLFLDEV